MIGILVAATLLGPVKPVFSINLDGNVVSPSPVDWRPGTRFVQTPGGLGVDFNNASGGWMMLDHNAFVLQRAMTISAWLKPRAYVIAGPQAQIMFRGDDRSGLDPISLSIHDDGKVFFRLSNEKYEEVDVSSPKKIPLDAWTHVVASFDHPNRILKLFINGELVASKESHLIPVGPLRAEDAAGLGIGNVQWDRGPHNQPYSGVIADLRLYNVPLEPKDVGFSPKGWLR